MQVRRVEKWIVKCFALNLPPRFQTSSAQPNHGTEWAKLWKVLSTNFLKLGHKLAQILKEEFPFKEECYKIVGCAMEVHKTLGYGFLEPVYQEAFALELNMAGIPFQKEKVLDVWYKETILNKKYVADFVCFGEVIVETKAMEGLSPDRVSQVLNYLKATNKKIGLLINFGAKSLQYKRVIL